MLGAVLYRVTEYTACPLRAGLRECGNATLQFSSQDGGAWVMLVYGLPYSLTESREGSAGDRLTRLFVLYYGF